ncbi:MAG: DUF3899 domain-containing protein [Bacilli bacterium]
MNRYFILLGGTVGLSLVYSLTQTSFSFLRNFIDSSFTLGLLCLLLGLLLLIVEGGVFNVWHYSMRRFTRSLNKQSEQMKTEDEREQDKAKDKSYLYASRSFAWKKPLVILGLCSCAASFLLSTFI